MTHFNSHKFVIQTASEKINSLAEKIQNTSDLDNGGVVKNELRNQLDDVFGFLKSYLSELKAKKDNIEKDIQSVNALIKKDLSEVTLGTDEIESSINGKNEDLTQLNDAISEMSLKLFKVSQKMKDVDSNFNIHIKDTESFIKNKLYSIENLFSKSDEIQESEDDTIDVELSHQEFTDFVEYIKEKRGEIVSIYGTTDDGQPLYINGNKKIRPPLDVIEDRKLSVNITCGTVLFYKEEGHELKSYEVSIGSTFNDFSQSIDDKDFKIEMEASVFVSFVEKLDDEGYVIKEISGKTEDETPIYLNDDNDIVPYLGSAVKDYLVSIKGKVEKGNVTYNISDVFDSLSHLIRVEPVSNQETSPAINNKNDSEDNFLKAVMDGGELKKASDKLFFKTLKIDAVLFIDMVDKIKKSGFTFIDFKAHIATNEGKESVMVNKDGLLIPSEQYLKENAESVCIEQAVIKTNTGALIGMMEALTFLD